MGTIFIHKNRFIIKIVYNFNFVLGEFVMKLRMRYGLSAMAIAWGATVGGIQAYSVGNYVSSGNNKGAIDNS